MAVNTPNDEYSQEPRARNGSGGAQGNYRHMETAVHSPMEQESKLIGMVRKALNDLRLKPDMGNVKKILNISDETKAADTVYPRHKLGYRVSEKRDKTKSRFAGAMVKGTKSLKNPPAPYHNR